MTESEAIARVDEPVTTEAIVSDLRSLGIGAGDTLLCHTSLSSIGWVSGDAPAVVDALRAVITDTGTLIMPTHTTQYSDPANWSDPPVPDDWVEPIKRTRPPYRPEITPSRGMGAIAECFRTYPDVHRGDHPLYSFAAWGATAESVVDTDTYDEPLGEGSPLSAVYDRHGSILHLGTGYETSTSLHLAEHRSDVDLNRVEVSAPVVVDGSPTTISYVELEKSTADFADVGAMYEREHDVEHGHIGAAESCVIDQRSLVDFAAGWFSENR